jgi:hypothetical protein
MAEDQWHPQSSLPQSPAFFFLKKYFFIRKAAEAATSRYTIIC